MGVFDIDKNIETIIDLDFHTNYYKSSRITPEYAVAMGIMGTCLFIVVLALLAICFTSLLDHFNVVNADNLMNRRQSNEDLQTFDGSNPSTPTLKRLDNGPPPAYNTLFVSVINVPPPTYQDAMEGVPFTLNL